MPKARRVASGAIRCLTRASRPGSDVRLEVALSLSADVSECLTLADMAGTDETRSVSITFRVTAELHERLQRAAEDENRPLSNWIETTLKRALAERDKPG